MEKEFVPYKESLELRDLGFNEPCFKVYDTMGYIQDEQTMLNMRLDYCSAPLYQQAFRWFRKKYKINGETPYLPNIDKYGIVASDMTIKPKDLSKTENFKRGSIVTKGYAQYSTHEEAELECLRKLIKIIKDGN